MSSFDFDSINEKEIPFFSLQGQTMNCKVIDIYDGDTCTIVLPLFDTCYKFKLRMYGYDTAEMKPKKNVENREEKKELAKKHKQFFSDLVLNKVVRIECLDWDKYGRLMGKLYTSVDDQDICVNDYMVENGMGYAYFGGTKQK